MILATESDIEVFVYEKSPHIKEVVVDYDDEEQIFHINIKLQFWYRFLYEKTFYKFIVSQIEQNEMFGVTYDVTLTS